MSTCALQFLTLFTLAILNKKDYKISQQSCESTGTSGECHSNQEVDKKLSRVRKGEKVGFSTVSPQPSCQMENPMTPSEPQHKHCPKSMRWGHETSDSKKILIFLDGQTDGRTDGRTDTKKTVGDSGPRVPVLYSSLQGTTVPVRRLLTYRCVRTYSEYYP